MNIASIILPRLNVVWASFADEGWSYTLFQVIRHKSAIRIKRRVTDFAPGSLKGKKQTAPFVLIITGKYVVSKHYPAGSEAAARIISNPAEFVCAWQPSADGGQDLAFMRTEQYEVLLEEFAVYGITMTETHFGSEGNIACEVKTAGEDFFCRALSAKEIFRPSAGSNLILSLIFSRLMLPVLVVALLVLTVNYFIQSNLQERYAGQTAILNTLRKSSEQAGKRQGGMDQLYAMMQPEARLPNSFIADRIASQVPQGVMLSEISIHPLSGKISANKPLALSAGVVSIKGECSESAPVAGFANALSELEITSSVQLRRMERGRNDIYIFEIEAVL